MAEMDVALDQYQEVETGEAFTLQNPRLLKVELSEGSGDGARTARWSLTRATCTSSTRAVGSAGC